MNLNNLFFYIYFFYVFQRLSEIFISNRNAKKLEARYQAEEVDTADSIRMKLMHVAWFLSWFIESSLFHFEINPFLKKSWLILIVLLLLFSQMIRALSMYQLKEFWTIKVFKMNRHPIVKTGLYRFFKHPNYLIVIIELALLPIMFKANKTALFFTLLNIFVIRKRIILEEKTLSSQSDY